MDCCERGYILIGIDSALETKIDLVRYPILPLNLNLSLGCCNVGIYLLTSFKKEQNLSQHYYNLELILKLTEQRRP